MTKTVDVNLRIVYHAIFWSTFAVVSLGIFREIYVHIYGLDTFLKDLRHINLEEKHSLQAWQESSLAFLGMLIAGGFAAANVELRRYWITLVFVMGFISIDEQVTIHQSSIVFLKKIYEFSGFLYFPWVIWAAPICIGLGLWFVPFLLRLPPRFALGFIAGGAIFVGGAVGLEIIGGKLVTVYGRGSWQYILEVILEESFESIGLAVFAVTAFEYWRQYYNGISINLVKRSA